MTLSSQYLTGVPARCYARRQGAADIPFNYKFGVLLQVRLWNRLRMGSSWLEFKRIYFPFSFIDYYKGLLFSKPFLLFSTLDGTHFIYLQVKIHTPSVPLGQDTNSYKIIA